MRAGIRFVAAVFFVVVICTVLVLLGLKYVVVTPAELKKPIRIAEIHAFADGGSMEFKLIGGDGTALLVRRVGSLQVARSSQSLYVVNYIWVMPVQRSAKKGSSLEAEIKGVLTQWLNEHVPLEQGQSMKKLDPQTLQSLSPDAIAAYDMLAWIDDRK